MVLSLSSWLTKCFRIRMLRAYSSWCFSSIEGCSSCGIGTKLRLRASVSSMVGWNCVLDRLKMLLLFMCMSSRS